MRGYPKAARSISYVPPEQHVFWYPKTQNVIIYDGPSQLNGEPILVIAGWATSNRKIGPMIQLWILTRDESPVDAVKSGGDAAICGNCKFRGPGGGKQRSCYVEWWRAPNNIHQALPKAIRETPEQFVSGRAKGHPMRIAAYGDTAAVPLHVWAPLLQQPFGWTAYTHQWRTCDRAYRAFCMASVDNEDEYQQARAMGWRTFRVRRPDGPLMPDEIICPHEQNEQIKCATCELCRGNARQAKSIVVTVHGAYAKWFKSGDHEN